VLGAKGDKTELVRRVEALAAYPAMLLPVPEGGFEVIFPNFAGLTAYGVKAAAAEKAAVQALTFALLEAVLERADPPRPSDPDRLHPDPDEPPGSRLVMLEPDKAAIRRRLGLEPQEKGKALRAFGLYGK